MPPGDESSGEDDAERSGPEPAAGPPDPPPRSRVWDPAVDSVWLGRRRPVRPLGRPRLSTVLMVAAFAALLVLYLVVGPGS